MFSLMYAQVFVHTTESRLFLKFKQNVKLQSKALMSMDNVFSVSKIKDPQQKLKEGGRVK